MRSWLHLHEVFFILATWHYFSVKYRAFLVFNILKVKNDLLNFLSSHSLCTKESVLPTIYLFVVNGSGCTPSIYFSKFLSFAEFQLISLRQSEPAEIDQIFFNNGPLKDVTSFSCCQWQKTGCMHINVSP